MGKKLLKQVIFASQKLYNWTPFHVPLEKTAPHWMQEQITADLSQVQKGKVSSILTNPALVKQHKLMHYSIQNHRVFAKGYTEIQRAYPITNALIFLAKELPDMELVVSFHDHLDGVDLGIPIFVFAKDPSQASHILMPDFEALKGYRKIHQKVREGNARYPWKKKEAKCMWRGGMTGGDFTPDNFLNFSRSKAITTSLAAPDWLDARFTDLAQCENPDQIQRKFSAYFDPYLSIPDQLKQKYQLVVDGNSCAYSKIYWGLFSSSLVIKQDSPNIQWYYPILKPYEHYLPVSNNLLNILQWAKEHDEEARVIAEKSQQFAEENLSSSKIIQYFYLLLKEYQKIMS
ncbi:MAG: hypothetical protein KR126chlam3_01143 [Chlamydiae bacterium]|nr:hypothetical protein [Chlamydiota bacterium]